MKIKIAIADDHPLVLNGLHHILDNLPDFEIIDEYVDGNELMAGLALRTPDVLLLDIQLPGKTGDELAPVILAQYPTVRILVLSNQDDLYYITNMMHIGVSGYVLKTTSEQILLTAICTVYNGDEYIDEVLKEKLIRDENSTAQLQGSVPALSKREKEVLTYIAADLTSQQIADLIFISKRTVDNHRQSLLIKLGVKNVAALVKKAMQLGILE
jgi:DNA-binding NarL/FixJ family response regulator